MMKPTYLTPLTFLTLSLIALTSITSTALADTPPAKVGTSAIAGKLGDKVTIEVKVEGPAEQETPLQVACLFEYTEGDIFNSPPALPRNLNGMVNLDEALDGLITDLRKSGRFKGHALETLLITSPQGTIRANKLLLIGLGDRTKFTPEVMEDVATVEFREAVRLGVVSYSHASDLKDAGIDSPTAEVAQDIIKGVASAYQTQLYLQQKQVSGPVKLKKVTLLAGPAFFETTSQSVTAALAALNKK